MILVSFSSAENALSNGVKEYNTFSSQGTKNPPFGFFLDTRYREQWEQWLLDNRYHSLVICGITDAWR